MKQPDPNSLQESRRKAGKLFRQGKLADAIEAQRAVAAGQLGAKVFPIEDYRTLAYFLQSNRDHDGAVDVLRTAESKQPGDFRVLRDLGRNLVLLNRPREALTHLQSAQKRRRRDAEIHDLLAHAYGLAGDLDRAEKSGEIALRLKAKKVERKKFPPINPTQPSAFSSDAPARNVIAFNLDRFDPATMRSTLFNARNARGLYPDWRCRFYVPAGVPQHVVNKLLAVGAQIVEVSANGRLKNSSLWNLHVLEDDGIDYFLLRDIHCTVNTRERAAVTAWLASGKWFHIMRDHHTHTDLIMPGLWGGVRGALPGVRELLKEMDSNGAGTGLLIRQLLSQTIWPRIRRNICIHDSAHRGLKVEDFPPDSALPDSGYCGQVSPPPDNLERRARERDSRPPAPENLVEQRDDKLFLDFTDPEDGLP